MQCKTEATCAGFGKRGEIILLMWRGVAGMEAWICGFAEKVRTSQKF